MPIKKKKTTHKITSKTTTKAKKQSHRPANIDQTTELVKQKKNFIYALGRRKSAKARVRYYKNGTGEIIVNRQNYKKYFAYSAWQKIITRPLELVDKKGLGQIIVKVKGGGKMGQAESISLGIARILIQIDPACRKSLKKAGLLTRDPRVKERKKYGLKRARRAPQWQKR